MMDRSHFPVASSVKLLTAPPVLRHPVSLEVPVRVQGDSADRAAFFEDTNTVLVFAQGAVLRIGGHLQLGQTVLLTNRTTRQQIPCRVSLVKQHGAVRGYAEIEFAQPAPNFWAEAAMPQQFSAAPAALAGASTFAAAAPVAAIRAAESFAQVDNIADAISAPPPMPLRVEVERPAPPEVDEIEQMLAAKRVETDAQAQEAARAASEFATKLLQPAATAPVLTAPAPARRRRGWVIAATAAAIVLTLGTSFGGWGGIAADAGTLVPPAPVAPAPPNWALPTTYAFGPSVSLPVLPFRTARLRAAFPLMPPVSQRRRALAGAATAAPSAVNRRDLSEAVVPEVSGEHAAFAGGSSVMTLVPTAPNAPAPVIPVESKLEPLRLILSAKPVYPVLARRARTQGDVVLHARVDETGKVTAMRVISGPPALRQAALDALGQWKYEPAKLNGKPVSVDTAVTIKFAL